MLPYVDSIVSTMQSGAKIMGHLYYHTALPPCRVECRIEKWSNSLFRKREGGIFEAVGDSIIDLGGVKTQEAAAAKGRRRRRRTEEETPLNFLVLFFKSDKWLAKMSEYYYSSCSHFAMPFLLWLLIVILATRKVYSARRRGNILL